jgi:hypothetical protein
VNREEYANVSQLQGMSSHIIWPELADSSSSSTAINITEEEMRRQRRNRKAQRRNRNNQAQKVEYSLNPKDQVERAMVENLYGWGIDPNAATCSERGKNFFYSAIITAIKTFIADTSSIAINLEDGQHSLPHHLPTDMKEAVRYVLSEEIKNPQETYRRIHDTISIEYGQNLCFAPYRAITQDCLQTELKKEYKDINESKLNPFERFSSFEMGKKECYE